MTLAERLRNAFLRWDRLVSGLVILVPLSIACLLGFLWLGEHGLLLPFIAACAVMGFAIYVLRRWLRSPKASADETAEMLETLSVAADPDWSEVETAAFDQARRSIEARTEADMPWSEMQSAALQVVDDIAHALGGEKKSALDFTLPEALLLIERASSRYRTHLRTNVPFSDQISLKTLLWLWGQRDRARKALGVARIGHRVARLAINPASAVLREIEQIVAGGNASYLNDQMMSVLQAILLEEVAFAAIELYSGRLKFSDSELLEIQLAATDADRARAARPDGPVRVLFVGQISAGKSSLVNALLSADRAETDMRPTTDDLVTYAADIDDIACHLIDTQGLDGGPESREEMLDEMTRSDLIVWVSRANRPARAPDLDLRQRFDGWFTDHADRRRPPVVAVATCIDQLTPGWPYPEHAIPDAALDAISTVVTAIARDTGGPKPHPVSTADPHWNVDAVLRAITAAMGEALLVQRNRHRLGAADKSGGVLDELRRGGRGLLEGTKLIGGRLASKPDRPDPKE